MSASSFTREDLERGMDTGEPVGFFRVEKGSRFSASTFCDNGMFAVAVSDSCSIFCTADSAVSGQHVKSSLEC